jgi:hypothetical protein
MGDALIRAKRKDVLRIWARTRRVHPSGALFLFWGNRIRIFAPYNPEILSLKTGNEGNFKSKDKEKFRPLERGYTGFTCKIF